jgi:hypothetical protein
MFWTGPPNSLQMWLSGAHIQNELSYKLSSKPILLTTTGHPHCRSVWVHAQRSAFRRPPPPHASSAMRRISKAPPPSSWLYTQLVSSMFKAVACIDAWAALPALNWNHANFLAPLTRAVSKDTLDTQQRARVSTGYELTPKTSGQCEFTLKSRPYWACLTFRG